MFAYTDLLLNVVFASTFLLSIKWVQNRHREDIITVGAINYIIAACGAAPQYFELGIGSGSWKAHLLGATLGAAYFIAFFLVIRMVRWVGAAASNVVSVLSILLPVSCGVLIWGEEPNSWQLVGVALALAALFLISGQRMELPANHRPWMTTALLLSFFLLAGISRLSQEAFKHECLPSERPVFIFAAFLTAAIPSLFLLARRWRNLSGSELGFGGVVGTANIMQTVFILRALEHFPGFLVFPVTSAGGLVLTTVVATRILGEKLRRRSYLGIGIAVVALVLLNY